MWAMECQTGPNGDQNHKKKMDTEYIERCIIKTLQIKPDWDNPSDFLPAACQKVWIWVRFPLLESILKKKKV